jgi:tetratricopeptide (TPR) repeat protein
MDSARRLTAWALLTLVGTVAFPLHADKIYKKVGAPVEGNILEETARGIKVGTRDGMRFDVTADDIDQSQGIYGVEREENSPDWIRGKTAFKEGHYSDAADAFDRANRSEKKDPWTKAYALFFLGESYRLLGRTNKDANKRAADAYDACLKEFPEHRFSPMAKFGRVEALLQGGDVGKAKQELEPLKTAGFSGCALQKVKLMSAQIMEREEKHKEAATQY